MAKDREIAIWISYEDTITIQNKFLDWIELLAKGNKILPPHQRKIFLKRLSRATLTIGRGDKVVYVTEDNTRIPMGTVHLFAAKLAYQTKPKTKWKFRGKIYTIDIKRLWILLRDELLRIYPHAQSEAIRMSAERFRMQAKPGSVEYSPSTRSYRS